MIGLSFQLATEAIEIKSVFQVEFSRFWYSDPFQALKLRTGFCCLGPPDGAVGDFACCLEPVHQQILVFRRHPCAIPHRLHSAAQNAPGPEPQKIARTRQGFIGPEMFKEGLEHPRLRGPQRAVEQAAQLVPGSSPHPAAAPQQRPAPGFEPLGHRHACRPQLPVFGPAYSVHRLVQM